VQYFEPATVRDAPHPFHLQAYRQELPAGLRTRMDAAVDAARAALPASHWCSAVLGWFAGPSLTP